MAKKSSTRQVATTSLPLQGQVSVVGSRPRVTIGSRDAAVADLLVTITGGDGRTTVPVTFNISLSVAAAGRARLTDESTGAVIESTRSGSAFVFKDVPVGPARSRAARRFRITNLRGNAAGIPSSPGGAGQIVAFVALSAPFRLAVSGSQQNVATTSP